VAGPLEVVDGPRLDHRDESEQGERAEGRQEQESAARQDGGQGRARAGSPDVMEPPTNVGENGKRGYYLPGGPDFFGCSAHPPTAFQPFGRSGEGRLRADHERSGSIGIDSDSHVASRRDPAGMHAVGRQHDLVPVANATRAVEWPGIIGLYRT
jgi:hypothetical protein